MTDAARLAAVLIRLLASGVVAWVVIGFVVQVGVLVANPVLRPAGAFGTPFGLMAAFGAALYLLPALLLFHFARPIGTWIARGLD